VKEKETASEKLIVIDIKLNRGLVVALSCVLVLAALLTFLTVAGGSASASETEAAQPASTGMRQYYLTLGSFFGDEVLGACAAGYHTASLWEMADPTNLEYNHSLGLGSGDSGQGPPTEAGWVRTGYVSSGLCVAGRGNCDAWTSASSADCGTLVGLPSEWTADDEDMGVWEARTSQCIADTHVWCIED
jgi:hypothetical protein